MNGQDDLPGAAPDEKEQPSAADVAAPEADQETSASSQDGAAVEAAAEESEATGDVENGGAVSTEAVADAAPEASENAAEEKPEDKAESDAEALKREAERVTALFSRSEGSVESTGGEAFRFARWTRPIAPAFFGLGEESVAVMQAGFREAADLVGVELAEEDAELGANILVYAVEDWKALREAPQLADLVPDLEGLIRLLSVAGASQYRIFTFSPEGGLRCCVSLLRYDETLSKLSAPSLALGQAVQALLLWSDQAFASESPVTVRRGGKALVKSRFARLLKAAYAPETPAYSEDETLALTLAETMRAARRARENGDREAQDGDGEPGEDVGRRRRGRRRRDRADKAPKAAAEANAEPTEAADAFDPLGGDPRPPIEEPSDLDAED